MRYMICKKDKVGKEYKEVYFDFFVQDVVYFLFFDKICYYCYIGKLYCFLIYRV